MPEMSIHEAAEFVLTHGNDECGFFDAARVLARASVDAIAFREILDGLEKLFRPGESVEIEKYPGRFVVNLIEHDGATCYHEAGGNTLRDALLVAAGFGQGRALRGNGG